MLTNADCHIGDITARGDGDRTFIATLWDKNYLMQNLTMEGREVESEVCGTYHY
jgi:hypothetical protein